MIENLEVSSRKILALLQGTPELYLNLKFFFVLPEEKKYKLIAPLSSWLQEFSLTEEDVVDVLDRYSKNISDLTSIDETCKEIKNWLLTKQNDNGSWPLAEDPGVPDRENAWATAVCILSLIKLKIYMNLSDETYDKKILLGIKWFFDENTNNKYILTKGWKNKLSDSSVNLFDTSIALSAISKYKEIFCGNEPCDIDNKVIEITENLLKASDNKPYWFMSNNENNEADVGLTSMMAMTLIHIYRAFHEQISENQKNEIQNIIFLNIEWICQGYSNDVGWNKNFEKSCYAIQALNKFISYFSNGFVDAFNNKERIEKINMDISKILPSEISKVENSFTHENDSWGWPAERPGFKIYVTSLATSTLLKIHQKLNIIIDFSVIFRAVNTLLEKFVLDEVTLDNTYRLCTLIDYLRYKKSDVPKQ